MAREWLSTPLSPHRKTAASGGRNSVAIGGSLCYSGYRPTVRFKCSLPLFFLFPFLPLPGRLAEEGKQKKSLFKSHGGEKSATSRDDVTRFSPHACTRDAPLMRACVIWRFSISDKHELSRRQHPPDATVVASRVLEWISFLFLLLLLLLLRLSSFFSFPPRNFHLQLF